jgi:hypothetical protein
VDKREGRPVAGGGNPRNCQSGGNDGAVFKAQGHSLQGARAPAPLAPRSPVELSQARTKRYVGALVNHGNRQRRRDRLIAAAVQKHGVGAIGLVFESLEADFGDELRVDARLEHLIDADPRAIALLEATR